MLLQAVPGMKSRCMSACHNGLPPLSPLILPLALSVAPNEVDRSNCETVAVLPWPYMVALTVAVAFVPESCGINLAMSAVATTEGAIFPRKVAVAMSGKPSFSR